MNLPFSRLTYLHHYPYIRLLHLFLVPQGLVLVNVLEEWEEYVEQDGLPALSHVKLVKGDASMMDGELDMLSTLYEK